MHNQPGKPRERLLMNRHQFVVFRTASVELSLAPSLPPGLTAVAVSPIAQAAS